MKPWEIERTKKKLNLMPAEKSIGLFFDLYRSAREMLKTSLKNEYPRLSAKELRIKINKFVSSAGRP